MAKLSGGMMLDGYMYVEIMRGLVGAFVDFSWDREGWIIPHTQTGRQAAFLGRAHIVLSLCGLDCILYKFIPHVSFFTKVCVIGDPWPPFFPFL